MTDQNDKAYDINFFRPLAGITRDSNRTISLFLIIWFLAVFGFQFLLIGTNKPTPEASLVAFNELWPKVEGGDASIHEQREFAKSLLMILGKNIVVSEADKAVLKASLSLTAAKLTGGSLDPGVVAGALGLEQETFGLLMTELLPHSLVVPAPDTHASGLPAIMAKYGTHPRGPLTDFTFLGFPFHYWYTAQFLLLLFVVLCLVYALRIEKLYRKNNFVEEH